MDHLLGDRNHFGQVVGLGVGVVLHLIVLVGHEVHVGGRQGVERHGDAVHAVHLQVRLAKQQRVLGELVLELVKIFLVIAVVEEVQQKGEVALLAYPLLLDTGQGRSRHHRPLPADEPLGDLVHDLTERRVLEVEFVEADLLLSRLFLIPDILARVGITEPQLAPFILSMDSGLGYLKALSPQPALLLLQAIHHHVQGGEVWPHPKHLLGGEREVEDLTGHYPLPARPAIPANTS